ncbi:MAG TPA: CYTH and CHAD domain-containing protein, partial [Stellaceae bacterium]|nr:CYTH and CHAD domain-containing protein [Stellaceae bacterium]
MKEARISIEVELKLAAEPGDLANLTRVLAARARATATVSQRLVSTYFDTPECALQQAGAILRVREQDGRFVQTVKTGDTDKTNLLARGEWEDAVADNRPDLRALESGPHVAAKLAAGLGAVFVSEIDRVAIDIEPRPGTRIEAAVDRGTIRTLDNARSEPVSEVELELKEGDPAALYDLALDLLETAPLRIALSSKAERGYRLFEGADGVPSPPASEPLVLAPDMTIEDALQRVGRACLGHMLRSEPAALAGKLEGVHQMRVAMRRLRSLLSAVKKMLPEAERRWVSDQIAALTGTLGPARNLDVFATELLPPARDEAPDQPGWDELSRASEDARTAAHGRVADAIRSPQHTAVLLRLLRWFETRGWRQGRNGDPDEALSVTIGDVAPAVLDRRRKKVRQRSRHFRQLPARRRHRLRIAVKKLRYTIELLDSLYVERDARPFIKRLKRVQDDLGHANDVRVAYSVVIELGRSAAHVEPMADAGAQLLARHQRYLAEREDKLRRQLRRLNKA